jgi:WD40 repeat protein
MDQITLWDIKSATRISTSAGHSDKVVSMRASMDRRILVSGSLDGSVIQWDTQTNSPTRVFNNFEGSLLDISPDGTKLAFSAVHNAIYIFDIPTGTQISRLYPGEIGPRCARLSPDNQYLVLGNVDGTISVYDVITGELIRSLSHHKSTVWDTTFSQSGELMASASHDRTVILWDCSSWEPLQVLKGHTSRVLGVRFSPDDRALASCSWDGTVRLWKVRP